VLCGLQVLKSGNPQQVLDSLHTLLQSIMTMYKIARYYGTPQRMSVLFSKVTNQMIRLCKDSILPPGKLWDQDKATLIANMQVRKHAHPV
jgi:dynein heavy chain